MNNLVVSNNNQQIAIKNNNTNLATSWIAFEVFGKKWLINRLKLYIINSNIFLKG